MKKIKIKSISSFIQEKYNNISTQTKYAFVCTALLTFITHIAYFINRWANEDDFHSYLSETNMIGSGRWMIGDIFSSKFLSPIVLLIIVIIALSLISIMIIKMFKVNKKIYIFIVSALLSTFPILALGFGYGFMVERYIMGMLLAVLAVFITDSKKFKINPIIGSICLAITMGYYQSYIAITIGLTMMKIIVYMFDHKLKDSLHYLLRFFIMGILGVIFYMLTVKVVCNISDIPLLDYKGINNMGSLPPINQVIELLHRTYIDFIFFFAGRKFINPLWYGKISQIIIFTSLLFLILYVIIKEKIYKRKCNTILILIFLIFIPLGFNIVDFIAYESETSSLNIYQFVLILIFPFIILNRIEFYKKDSNIINTLSWLITISGILLIWNNISVTNIYYLKVNDYYTTTVQLTNRIYDRIEQMPDFEGNIPVMVGNKEGIYMDRRVYKEYYTIFLYDQGLWDQFIGYAPRPEGTDFKFHYLVQNIIGVNLISVSPEKYEEIYNSEEYKQMESWPSSNCMKYIDGILVVKLS